MNMDRTSYIILALLSKEGAVNEINSFTIDEIASREQCSKRNTLQKKIKILEKEGLLSEGLKVGRAKSYYITEEGIALLPVKKEEILNESKEA